MTDRIEKRRRSDVPEGGATMQIDALADDLEEIVPPAIAASPPPPLPVKKTSPLWWIVGALVVLLAVGAAVGASRWIVGRTPVAAAPAPPAPSVAARPRPVEPETPAAPPSHVVQIEEVVVEAPPAREDVEETTTVIAP